MQPGAPPLDALAPTRAHFLQVRHRTVYRYNRPVAFDDHRGMFRPHDSYDLRLLDIRFSVSPEASIRWVHDVFSNAQTVFSFPDVLADRLEIECVFRVSRNEAAPPDFPIAEHARKFPFEYAREQVTDLRPSIVASYADPDGAVLTWAQRFVAEADGGTWDALRLMNAAIHDEFDYRRREETGVQTPADTLRLGAGSCRDFAVLMLEATRRLGFASRFVTGYLFDPAVETDSGDMRGAGATHAWAQVFLPGSGWVEFDPTNGLVASGNLIRTGVARTPEQAAPLRGSYRGDAADAAGMEVEVEVASLGSGPAGRVE